MKFDDHKVRARGLTDMVIEYPHLPFADQKVAKSEKVAHKLENKADD